MKKRSMLALASLATGFVVAAVTPSHAADKGPLDGLNVSDTLHSAGDLVSHDSLAPADSPATGHTTGHAPGLVAGQD
ncbi:hypothetical protein [Streptomyces sp. LaBMicrA B280]|uniref:hypothetical protein n=1 Tax=Streptomyces sp. LaBMicrA B280 TaxID=3391001 RepID=UPI003BA4B27A